MTRALRKPQGHAFADLDDDAKERAREWWRECEAQEFEPEFTLDDCVTVAGMLGFDVTREMISWDVSCCQGSGACFTGRYGYSPDSATLVRDYAPQDVELNAIASMLAAVQAMNGHRISATIERIDHHYCHENTVRIDAFVAGDMTADGWDIDVSNDVQTVVTAEIRRFMRWIHRQITDEYEYRISQENIDESLEQYTFDEDGNSFDPQDMPSLRLVAPANHATQGA